MIKNFGVCTSRKGKSASLCGVAVARAAEQAFEILAAKGEAPVQAVVFDFDGTLARLTIDFPGLTRKIAVLAEAFLGWRPEPPVVPVLEWLDVLAVQVAEAEGPDVGREFRSRGRLVVNATELDAAREGQLFPRTLEILGRLRALGVAVGIITRNSTAAVRSVFPDMASYCEVFLAREDVARVKPDPLHVRSALSALGVAADRALTVGDHAIDIEGGRRAGTRTAGVASGALSREGLAAVGPDFLAPDVAALVDELAVRGWLGPGRGVAAGSI